MNEQELENLRILLQKFLDVQDDKGTVSIERALSLESAARREAYVSEELNKIRYIIRWVIAHRASVMLNPPTP